MQELVTRQIGRKVFFATFLFLTVILNVVVIFNIPIARQIFGFLFLTFVPGIFLVQLLGLNEISNLERIVLSVGSSIAFLMIAGMLLNEFATSFGLFEPLQPLPLLVILNGFLLLCGSLIYKSKRSLSLPNLGNYGNTLILILPSGLLILSLFGSFLMNVYDNNISFLFMITSISLLFAVLAFRKKLNLPSLYAVALFMIALSILFHSSLISQFIVPFGSDSNVEFALFKVVDNNHFWSEANPFSGLVFGRFNSMLSITILPAFYSNILNLDATTLFKTLYPIIFSFLPLCLYAIWQGYIGRKYAFIAAFLLVAQSTFYTEMLGLNRQIIAELFFVLLLLIVLNKKIRPSAKSILFVVFGFCLITSHYGLALIFLFFISAVTVYYFVTKQAFKKIGTFLVVSFSTILFAWYIYTSGASVFESIVEFSNYVTSQLANFLNLEARGQTVLLGLGLSAAPTTWNVISRLFAYATQFLIVLGFIGLLQGKLKHRFDKDYLILTVTAMALLIALIVVPGLANTLNMTRFYHILLFFGAPLCVLGAVFLMNLVSKNREFLVPILLILILVPYFLFQTSFVFEVTKSDTFSISLSKYRMPASRLYDQIGYIDVYSFSGANWLSKNVNFTFDTIYSDAPSRYNVLRSYGLIDIGYSIELDNFTTVNPGGTVYLGSYNTQEKLLWGYLGSSWNLTELSFDFNDLNKVYTNDLSEVYKNPLTANR